MNYIFGYMSKTPVWTLGELHLKTSHLNKVIAKLAQRKFSLIHLQTPVGLLFLLYVMQFNFIF